MKNRSQPVQIALLITILCVILCQSCKEEASPLQEIDPQLIGKWKIRRSNQSKAAKVCYVNTLDIQQDNLIITFTTGEGGVYQSHVYSGPHRFEAGNLFLDSVATLKDVVVREGDLQFRFEYYKSLDYFCAYLNWNTNHLHDTFDGVGTK